jgi:hypothetical protein
MVDRVAEWVLYRIRQNGWPAGWVKTRGQVLARRLCGSAIEPVLGPLEQIWDQWRVVGDQSDVVPARVGAVIDVTAAVATLLDVLGLHRGQDEVVDLALRD